MSTRKETVEYIVEHLQGAGDIRYLKMFGEYGIYCDEKMAVMVADDCLYVKPTDEGRAYIGEVEEVPPYPGAKLWFLIPEERWDDSQWLSELVQITAAAMPMPKKKSKK